MKNKLFSTKNLTLTAVLTALATVLAYFPHIHGWVDPIMEIEFSDVPVFLAAYYVHPVCGIIVAALKSILHLPMTETAFIGEALTFVQSVAFLLPTFFFREKQSRIDLTVKLGFSLLLNFLFGLIAGPYCVVPFLREFRGISIEPNFLLVVVLPYFAIRSASVAVATALVGHGVHRAFLYYHTEVFLRDRSVRGDKPKS